MSWNQNLLMLRLFREKVVMGCFFLVGFGFVKGFFLDFRSFMLEGKPGVQCGGEDLNKLIEKVMI